MKLATNEHNKRTKLKLDFFFFLFGYILFNLITRICHELHFCCFFNKVKKKENKSSI